MSQKTNNVGFLRLVFAGLVIVGHAPEMLDGNRSREPLHAVFGVMSLGELAVDAFFLLSGYLIVKSMVGARSVGQYLERRVLRIYPAFIVAYLLTVFVLGPLVHAQPWLALPETLWNLVALQPPPNYPGQLPGMTFYPFLNGTMWTIAYEFRCYLLVAVLGMSGLLARRRLILAVAACAVVFAIVATFQPVQAGLDGLLHYRLKPLLGVPNKTVRLTAIFLVGACFYLYRDEVFPRLTGPVAAVCAAAAAALMVSNPHGAEAALTTLGAAALFWLAFKARLGPLHRINGRWDISYGTYLYGWPAAAYIRWLDPEIGPWALAGLSLAASLALGAASWWGLETWVQHWAHRARPAASRPAVVQAPQPL